MIYEADTYYRFSRFVPSYIATSGVMNLVEEKECYWVLDVIASYAKHPAIINSDYFKVVKVVLNQDKPGCVFTIEDEIKGKLIHQEIEFTDLDEDLKIWVITEGAQTTILLPSEY